MTNTGTFWMRLYLSMILLFGTTYSQTIMAVSDCDCETISCGPCESEVDIKFYTLKCDSGNRVKSCKKPVCAPIEDKANGCRLPASAASAEEIKKVEKVAEQEPQLALENVKNSIGIVVVAQGTSMIQRQGKTFVGKIGFKVFEKDYIETGADGKLKIKFKDDNVVNLTPDSKLTIEEHAFDPAKGNKKTLLNLIYGKVRSSVKQSYNGENYYEIKTKTAVAGVRGTDFVVSYRDDEKNKIESTVQTISGSVVLSDVKKTKKTSIPASTFASFVIEKGNENVFNESDIGNFIARGYLTPVFKMTSEELRQLEINTNFSQEEDSEARTLASSNKVEDGKSICSSPSGDFNQCAWICNNNPKGEKKCRTDLPTVDCVRKRCNANGRWAEETRLPASFQDMCDGIKPLIKPCDY